METPVISILGQSRDLKAYVVSASNREKKRLQALNVGNVEWRSIYYPISGSLNLNQRWKRFCRTLCLRLIRLLKADFPNLVYRFNEINGFVGHKQKLLMSRDRQAREALAGNFVDPKLGKPFARNKSVYGALYRLYYGRWQCAVPAIAGLYSQVKPDVVVLWNPQSPLIKDYLVPALQQNIKVMVVIASWDMLTTKGPIGPGVCKYVVKSRAMRDELVNHHGVTPDRIEYVGWPQMDAYCKTKFLSRDEFFRKLAINPDRKLIVFAANTKRLGAHEPSIVDYLAEQIERDSYAEPCFLIVRPHPKDAEWEQRFEHVMDKQNIRVQPAEWGRLDYLANLMKHADIVIASQGSIAMDAIAVDTCVINIGFDGSISVPEHESSRHWYEMDHYRPVIESGGVYVVDSFDNMDETLNAYLNDPNVNAVGREVLRSNQLHPMDGNASARIVNIINDLAADKATTEVSDTADSAVSA